MRCRNPSCKAKLPKGQRPPLTCGDACTKAAMDHALTKSRAAEERARKRAENPVEREAKAERKQFRQKKQEFKANDYRRQFSLTRKVAQRLGNLLDAAKPCICCGRPRDGAVFCGGHYKTSGAHPELALSILNIHGQENVNCNMHLSGNISGTKGTKGFKEGLAERYGREFVDYLDTYRSTHKRTCEELIALRKEYAAEIRRLEKGLAPSRNWRALPQQHEQAA